MQRTTAQQSIFTSITPRTDKGYPLSECWQVVIVRCKECRRKAWAWIAPQPGDDTSAEEIIGQGCWEHLPLAENSERCPHLPDKPGSPISPKRAETALTRWRESPSERQDWTPHESLNIATAPITVKRRTRRNTP